MIVVSDATGLVITVKVAVDFPLAIVTVWGTAPIASDEVNVTMTPSGPAFGDTVTVPLTEVPPTTDEGVSKILVTVWADAAAQSANAQLTAAMMRPIGEARRHSEIFITILL